MFGGVFDRFPTLRMAFLEAGSAWVLCVLERMQREYEHWGVLLGELKREPKEHLKSGRLFFEGELDDELLPYIVQVLGDNVLVFASDFPHFTRPDHISRAIKRFQERRDLSDETKRRILGENARRLYKIN
jgi:predicted TIM-barrel fold metal-dependent hydrolase